MQCFSPFDVYSSPYQQSYYRQPSRRSRNQPTSFFAHNEPRSSPFGLDSDLFGSSWGYDDTAYRRQQLQRQAEIEARQRKEAELQKREQIRQLERARELERIQELERARELEEARQIEMEKNKVRQQKLKQQKLKQQRVAASNRRKNAGSNTRQNALYFSNDMFPFADIFGDRYRYMTPEQYAYESSDEEETESIHDSNEPKAELEKETIPQEDEHTSESETECEEQGLDNEDTDYESCAEESEEEVVKDTSSETLKEVELDSQNHVDTYNRINKSYTSKTNSGAVVPYSIYNSWIKVLQKSQMQIEKLYEQLDRLDISVMSQDNKMLKKQLTKQTVAYADKIESLVSELQQKIQLAKESESSESESDASETSLSSSPPVPKAKKGSRKVILETVQDESFSEFSD